MPHKVRKVLAEFKKRTLRSSSGEKVTNPKQAQAIGLSEDRKEHGGKKPARKKGGGYKSRFGVEI